MTEQLAIRMFPRNPARYGTGVYIVFETLATAGGILTSGEIRARCLRASVANVTARVSNLREMGIEIRAERGTYELMRSD